MALNKDLYNEVDASGQGFQKIEPGIYICEIKDYTDDSNRQLLKIKFDIVEGKYNGYYAEQEKQFSSVPSDAYIYRSYKDTAMSMFKGFITALEKSNSNYDFVKANYDFATIKGKRFVGVFEQEEIPFADDKTGEPIIKIRLTQVRSMDKLRANEIKFSTDVKRLSGDDLEKFKKESYTEKVVQERIAEKEKVTKTITENDLPY